MYKLIAMPIAILTVTYSVRLQFRFIFTTMYNVMFG